MAWNTKYAISTNIKGQPMLYTGPIAGWTLTFDEAIPFDSYAEAEQYITDHWPSDVNDYEVVDFTTADV